MSPDYDFHEDLSDFMIPERSYSDDEFEVLPDTGRGPSTPIILHMKTEIEQAKKELQREYGDIKRQSKEIHELTEMTKIEKEIKKYLQTYDNELAYTGSIRPQINDDADEDEKLVNNKNLSVFFDQKYFKAYPASDSDISTSSTCTSTTSDDTVKSVAAKNNDLYLNFSTGKFNYTFPYANQTVPKGKRRL